MSLVRGGGMGMKAPAQHTGRVRAFVDGDLPQIVALQERIFEAGEAPETLAAYLDALFCRHPWRDDALPSLIYEAGDGRILGCLGVLPRPMSLRGRPIRAVVSHSFMVAPDHRSTPIAMQLIKAWFSGPQDVSIADANQLSRPFWDLVGGVTPLLYRLRWTRPLRLGRYALAFAGRHGRSGLRMAAFRPLAGVVDHLAAALRGSPFSRREPEASGEELDDATLAACLTEIPRSRALRPEYDDHSVKWMLGMLKRKIRLGTLRQVLVRDRAGRVVGWYLYYINPGSVSEVVQIGARDDAAAIVLRHLIHDAWRHGAVALSGQVDPTLLPALSDANCFLRFDPNLGIRLHTAHPAVLEAVMRGDAFLTRLEGEWWIPFGGS